MAVELIHNLAVLIALSILSGFIENRFNRHTTVGKVLQGLLFASVATFGMLQPFVVSEGIIFDGRSVLISLGALFFGPVTGVITAVAAIAVRYYIGGDGVVMGVLSILSSLAFGIIFHYAYARRKARVKSSFLYPFGLIVHIVMIGMMYFLPSEMRRSTLDELGITIIIFYPIATVIIGKILSDLVSKSSLDHKLKSSEERFRTLVENAFDGIYLIRNKKFEYVNPRFTELMGYTFEEVTAEGFDINETLTEESRKLVAQRFEARKRGEYVAPRYEAQLIDKYGNTREVEFSTAAIKTRNEVQIVGLVRDISGRKRNEKALALSNQKLQQTIAEKDKLFSIIAHDLRSPFMGLLGLTEIMAEQSNDFSMDEMRNYSRSLRKTTVSLYALLENLLDWSRLSRNMVNPQMKEVALQPLIDECLQQQQYSIGRKELTITFDSTQTISAHADPSLLVSVFRNLISNAIKFTSKGGEIGIEVSDVGNHEVQIVVSDTGVGISPKKLLNLFSHEKDIINKGTEGEPSTGLGLVICKELLEKMHGTIRAESVEGAGSRFVITLRQPQPEAIGEPAFDDSPAG
jgi:PAS domain S-box-containing protein